MASNNDFYGGGSTTNRRAPPPPPNPAAATTTTTATARRATAATKTASRSRQTYQSNRSTAPSRPSGAGVDDAGNNNNTNSASSSQSTSRSTMNVNVNNRSSLSGARKAPVASRPAGSYYNSTAAPMPIGSESSSSNNGLGAANLYASSSVPAATTGTDNTTDNKDTWDDWGSPAAKTSTTTTAAAANPHSSWVAPASNFNNDPTTMNTSTAAAAATNDWYSASAGSATNPNASAAGAAPSALYTSSGFNNQQSQQQHQQQQPMQPGNEFYQNNSMQQQQQQQQPFLSGAMDSSAPTMSAMNSNSNGSINNINSSNTASNAMPSFSMFMPSTASMEQQTTQDAAGYSLDEAPLLEELGINIQHILLKTKAVVFPFSRFGGDQIDPAAICQDGDLPGPVALLLLLGGEMVLAGKLQFGYIYIYGLCGCIAMTFVVNLISPNDAVSFWTVTSIMGYALLPVNILAFFKIFIMNLIHLQTFGNILGGLTVLWSTLASTRLLELGCDLQSQRYLIAYPLLLFYSAFVMMTIL